MHLELYAYYGARVNTPSRDSNDSLSNRFPIPQQSIRVAWKGSYTSACNIPNAIRELELLASMQYLILAALKRRRLVKWIRWLLKAGSHVHSVRRVQGISQVLNSGVYDLYSNELSHHRYDTTRSVHPATRDITSKREISLWNTRWRKEIRCPHASFEAKIATMPLPAFSSAINCPAYSFDNLLHLTSLHGALRSRASV